MANLKGWSGSLTGPKRPIDLSALYLRESTQAWMVIRLRPLLGTYRIIRLAIATLLVVDLRTLTSHLRSGISKAA